MASNLLYTSCFNSSPFSCKLPSSLSSLRNTSCSPSLLPLFSRTWKIQSRKRAKDVHAVEMELKRLNEDRSTGTSDLVQDAQCNYRNEISTVEYTTTVDVKRTFQASKQSGTSIIDMGSGLKFVIILGLLTFHVSQKAVFASEFSAAQPIADFWDFDDISTGFASAFLLIFFSELGDKTFFIAALLAARNSGAVIFAGTFGALTVMSVISVAIGRAFHYVDGILPFRLGEMDFPIDDFVAACLLVYFGVTTLLDAASSDGLKSNEEQKEAELAISNFSGDSAGLIATASTIVSTFILVFVAEWGDKSFFSTIALAAASSPIGVVGGALAGHALATLIAVIGGSLLGTFLSEKVVAYIGGSLFIAFAIATLIEIVN